MYAAKGECDNGVAAMLYGFLNGRRTDEGADAFDGQVVRERREVRPENVLDPADSLFDYAIVLHG